METADIKQPLEILEYLKEIKCSKGIECPHCGCPHVVRNGTYSGKQRYLCRSCNKTFSDLTDTPFSNTHKLEKWLPFMECTIKGISLRESEKVVGVAYSTLFYWRHKLLTALKQGKTKLFKDIVEADDIYLAYSEKGKKRFSGGAPRKRGSGTGHIVLNDDKVCILAASDRYKENVFNVASRGNLERCHVDKVIGNLIDKNNILCCNLKAAYKSFSLQKRIKCYRISFSGCGETELYNLKNINSYMYRFYKWFLRFKGVASKYLNNYLSLFKFLNNINFINDMKAIKLIIESVAYAIVRETYQTLTDMEFVL